ncbi:hypothetical protein [Pseudoalteromonas sp. MMG012]|uniref:hypothetical protein n=1 Tax=Pseudoalteromonas sp. MMG012 TaxID=2822686 RepID=UPI001B39E267|nr:hypothetical protein [Pseudoalteromonas sp. MMG012]MBQ4852801.1 hypothetical protein [Pseudoalteromonas sp. MMG012]
MKRKPVRICSVAWMKNRYGNIRAVTILNNGHWVFGSKNGGSTYLTLIKVKLPIFLKL